MATTQESYRLQQRNQRYTTKLAAFANGMYLTDQIIPEGYARVMLNYDIDDTGSHIKPRYGRELLQTITLNTADIGAVTLTDYVYAYDETGDTAILPQDLVLSYGLYVNLQDLTGLEEYADQDRYILKMDRQIDESVYTQNPNTEDWETDNKLPVTTSTYSPGWAVSYDKSTGLFKDIPNKNVGAITARIIKNAYAFDKPVVDDIRKPVAAVLNNELVAFSAPSFTFREYPNTPIRNELLGYQNDATISKLKLQQYGDGLTLVRAPLDPRKLNASEAASSGFNLLANDPYTFEDSGSGYLMITGLLPYNAKDRSKTKIVIHSGEAVSIRAYYQYMTAGQQIKYRVTWFDMSYNDPVENVLHDWGTNTFNAGDAFYFDYTPAVMRSLVRIEMRINDDETTLVSGTLGIVCDNVERDVEAETFDLSSAKGTIVWNSCLGLYGVEGAPDTIIFSAPEDPSYFPYPFNLLTFDNEILAVHNYLDMLLVVTVDSIWLVTIGDSIMTSTQKKVLDNIYIPEIDAINLVVLKDQIFFKTDTQFYVLKPNNYRSDATDLKNYINSTAIANYTKNFTEETVKLLNSVYRKVWQELTDDYRKQIRFMDFDVTDIVSYIRNEEVHYVYTMSPLLWNSKLTKQEVMDNVDEDIIIYDNLNLHLVYNTLTRSWRIYLVCVGEEDVHYKPVLYRNKQSGDWYEFIARKTDTTSKLYITKQTYNTVSDNVLDGDWQLTRHYNNYPYIDSGNVAIDDTFNKRFRELQFNVLNRTNEQINFFTDFKLDGKEWMEATRYIQRHILDPKDPEYGSLFVTPVDQENLHIYGTSVPTDKTDPNPFWSIDLSCFPDLAIATVRLTLQGKGRRASFQLLNTDLKQYELSDVTWVYRIMNAR